MQMNDGVCRIEIQKNLPEAFRAPKVPDASDGRLEFGGIA